MGALLWRECARLAVLLVLMTLHLRPLLVKMGVQLAQVTVLVLAVRAVMLVRVRVLLVPLLAHIFETVSPVLRVLVVVSVQLQVMMWSLRQVMMWSPLPAVALKLLQVLM